MFTAFKMYCLQVKGMSSIDFYYKFTSKIRIPQRNLSQPLSPFFSPQYLSQVDRVLFLRDGQVADAGSHSDLMAGDTEYAALIRVFYSQEKKKEASLDSLGGQFCSFSDSFLFYVEKRKHQRCGWLKYCLWFTLFIGWFEENRFSLLKKHLLYWIQITFCERV